MTPEQQELLMIKGQVSDMDSADQMAIKIAAERMRGLLRSSPVAGIAFAMVALEIAIDPKSMGLPA